MQAPGRSCWTLYARGESGSGMGGGADTTHCDAGALDAPAGVAVAGLRPRAERDTP